PEGGRRREDEPGKGWRVRANAEDDKHSGDEPKHPRQPAVPHTCHMRRGRVQHQSAATTAHLANRIQPLPTSIRWPKTFSDQTATSYGSEGWGFESLRARPGQRPLPAAEGAFLLTHLLTAVLSGVRYRAGEDVCGLGELIADHVGVHAQGDGRVGVPEPCGDDMNRYARQQGRGMDMAKIVQPGMGQRIVWLVAAFRVVVRVDQDGHER